MKPIIWIFVEGDSDERFFNKIIKPKLQITYQVLLYKYANETEDNFKNMIERCNLQNEKYFITGDIDDCICTCYKKIKLHNKTDCKADFNNIIIVIKEIESWYLAGLPEKYYPELNIKRKISETNSITKEDFMEMKPNMFHSEINFMNFILERYDMITASKKNKSFSLFYNMI